MNLSRKGTSVILLLVGIMLVTLAPLAADAVTVKGTVLLPDGKPADGARVFVRTSSGWDTPVVEGRCDATGRFSVIGAPAASIPSFTNLLALLPGYAAAWVDGKPGEETTLRLGANPATLTGTVQTPEGQPLAGAEVYVSQAMRGKQYPDLFIFVFSDPDPTTSPLHTQTGADGNFSLEGWPAGVSLICAVRAEGYATVFQALKAGGTPPVVRLAPEAKIGGRVLAQGQPVGGVTVVAYARYMLCAQATTAADGSYTLGRLGGPVILRVSDPPEGLAPRTSGAITLQTGQSVTGFDLALTPGALLSGKVTDVASGKPVAGVAVEAYPHAFSLAAPREQYTAKTGEDGTYQMRVSPGQWEMRASYRSAGMAVDWSVEPGMRSPQVAEGDTAALNFTIAAPPQLTGRVLRPDGTPAAGVEVLLGGRSGHFAKYWADPTKTDAQGRFSLAFRTVPQLADNGMARGARYALLVARDPVAGQIGFGYVNDVEGTADIRLAQGGFLVTTATDAEGRPVPKVEAQMQKEPFNADGNYRLPNAVSDEQGRLRIGPLPAGQAFSLMLGYLQDDFRLDRSWDYDNLGWQKVTAGEEKQLPPLHIDLRGRSVDGTVVDADGNPVDGAVVSAFRDKQVAQTDAQGAFSLSGLPIRGPDEILVTREWTPSSQMKPADMLLGMRNLEGGRNLTGVTLRLEPPGTLTGQLVDAQGRPVAGAMVMISPRLQDLIGGNGGAYHQLQQLGYHFDPTLTDAQGRWKAPALAAGGPYLVWFKLYREQESFDNGVNGVMVKGGEMVDVGKITIKGNARVPGVAPPAPGAGGPAPGG